MERDPAYAQEIFAKIDARFAFDVARKEVHIELHIVRGQVVRFFHDFLKKL